MACGWTTSDDRYSPSRPSRGCRPREPGIRPGPGSGINSETGLTLGGGIGWQGRKHGLTIDHLLSADVVTADGEVLKASAEQNAHQFWEIRGGGGHFGIATA